MTQETGNVAPAGQAYHYRTVRPLSAFSFAALAAFGAMGLVGLARAGLVEAMQSDVIGEPPDLRRVLVVVENRVGLAIAGAPDEPANWEEPYEAAISDDE